MFENPKLITQVINMPAGLFEDFDNFSTISIIRNLLDVANSSTFCNTDRTCIRFFCTGYQSEYRSLTASIPADKSELFTSYQIKGNVLENFESAKGFFYSA